MFTQCSKCETVFQLSAEILRVAGGQVRCGICGEVFNALARLAEDSSDFTTSESALALETRADSILESVVPAEAPAATPTDFEEFVPAGVEIARIEVLDWPEEDAQGENAQPPEGGIEPDDRSLEFTLPPGELDRIFVESKKSAQPLYPPAMTTTQAGPQPVPESESQPAAHLEPTPAPASASASASQATPAAPEAPEIEILLVPESAVALPPHPESPSIDALPASGRISGFEVPDDVRRDVLAGFEQHILKARPAAPTSASSPNPRNRPFIWWLSAAIALSLLLLAQLVHQNQEWLISHVHGPSGAVPNLSAYQLRQWGVTGEPDANGTLHLRASILNSAAQPQPYPLLRVTLADRFGKSIGSRDFEPSEYMDKPTAGLLAPGERADASLRILDPGKNAEGFEVDVCLRSVDKRISCANAVAAQTKP